MVIDFYNNIKNELHALGFEVTRWVTYHFRLATQAGFSLLGVSISDLLTFS
jgi:hypothetical protein